jgi:hypothetical protein
MASWVVEENRFSFPTIRPTGQVAEYLFAREWLYANCLDQCDFASISARLYDARPSAVTTLQPRDPGSVKTKGPDGRSSDKQICGTPPNKSLDNVTPIV